MKQWKIGVQRTVFVFMEDEDDPKHGKEGISSPLSIVYCANGGQVTTKTDTTSWAEVQPHGMSGWYKFNFHTNEMATAGVFAFSVRATSCFDFPGAMLMLDHDIGDVWDETQTIITDVSDAETNIIAAINALESNVITDISNLYILLGTAQGTDHAADLLKIINALYGRVRWDLTTDPWEITLYAEDNSTLVAEFTYARDGVSEDRVRQ